MTRIEQIPRLVQDDFFVLDSEHLEPTESRLFGFTFINNQFTDNIKDLNRGIPEADGAYVCIIRENDKITVYQDYAGCYGLYLFRKDTYFALSNSFTMLTEYLRGRYPLTLNQEYADYMLTADMCSAIYGETMIREITTLDRCTTIDIDVHKKTLNLRYRDYHENTVDPGSEEGIVILDAWREKWVKRIQNLYQRNENIRTDLTGGFDSRETFALFISSGIDLNRIFVHTNTDTNHTHQEDQEIAAEIAEQLGFTLNNKKNILQSAIHFSTEETLDRSFYPKLCFHQQMYFQRNWNASRLFSFTGNGGECIRDYWHGTAEALTENAVRRCAVFVASPKVYRRMRKTVRSLVSRSLESLKLHFSMVGKPIQETEFGQILYRETRCRNHFGKQVVEAWLGNNVMLNPLMDSDLHKLKLYSEECPDRNLLSALILERYAPMLRNTRFDSGKSIRPETGEYARKLNNLFPVAKMPLISDPVSREASLSLSDPQLFNSSPKREKPEIVLQKSFAALEIKMFFSSYYDKKTYQIILADMKHRGYFPLSLAFSVFGIVKVLQDIQSSETTNLRFSSFLTQAAAHAEANGQKPNCQPDKLFLLYNQLQTRLWKITSLPGRAVRKTIRFLKKASNHK